MAAGLGLGAMQMAPSTAPAAVDRSAMDQLMKDVSAPAPGAEAPKPQPKPAALPTKNKANELLVAKAGHRAGLRGEELAAFLAQTAHESQGFNRLKEAGGDDYFRKMYDPQHAPKTAAILGNTKPGDGVRYAGRGFMQLTGRDNYEKAGKALNLPLLKKPQLAARPDVAARIAVWFWKSRVRPNVSDFTDVEAVTKQINPALKHLDRREQHWADYARLLERINISA